MRVLFFAPFSNIWQHASVEAVLAEQLMNMGHEVEFVRCNGLLDSYCPAMAEAGIPQGSSFSTRESICKKCRSRAANIDGEYGFEALRLDDFYFETDDLTVNSWVSQLTLDNWEKFEIDSIPIGKLAAYEFLLTNKVNSLRFDRSLFPYYLNQFRNSAKTLIAAERLLRGRKPHIVIVHNILYSSNRVFSQVADSEGIPSMHLGVGTDLKHYGDSFSLFADARCEIELNTSEAWRRASSRPISFTRIKAVTENFLHIAKAKSPFTYSSKTEGLLEEDVYNRLSLDPHTKTCVALLSSADERFAADVVEALPYSLRDLDEGTFGSQVEWVEHLISIFGRRKDLQLVIRVHPRLFPNKRERVESEAGMKLRDTISDLPPNVVVNWPDQNLSLYDLAQITDVALNATSSAGGELLALGIPVVCHEPLRLFSYPREFNIIPENSGDYESGIEQALQSGWSLENSRNAFRWRAFLFNDVARNLDESIPPRARWTLLRILNGLDLRTSLWVPRRVLRFLETREMHGRSDTLAAAVDLDDMLRHRHTSLADTCSMQAKTWGGGEDFDEMKLVQHTRNLLFNAIFGRVPNKAQPPKPAITNI